MRHNLLTTPLIAVPSGDRLSLPEVLAGLVDGRVDGFPELAAHQRHAWHAFLVQMAGLALHRAGRPEPPADPETWRDLLRGLTPDHPDDAPWHLVVTDWSRPALLQPALPGATVKSLKGPLAQPDQIDILVTAKNHDVKSARLARPSPGHWLFALVSLQTMQGFLGAGNYGIARMNGGFSSRPAVSLVPRDTSGPAAQFRRDLRVLLATRNDLQVFGYPETGGLALVWLADWDGAASLPLTGLDPWFIEICRRLRLAQRGEDIVAYTGGSKAARIEAKMRLGVIGDPWTPVFIKESPPKALTVSAAGFGYHLLWEVLFKGNYAPALMQAPHDGIDDGPVAILARVLARGQGVTAGYHERRLPVPDPARNWLLPENRDRVARVAQRQVEDADMMITKVLSPALLAFRMAGKSGKPSDDDRAWTWPWRDDLDRLIDESFFDLLWQALAAADDHDGQMIWQRFLKTQAETVLERAFAAAPSVSSRSWRAQAEGGNLFNALLRKSFPDLAPPRQDQEESAA